MYGNEHMDTPTLEPGMPANIEAEEAVLGSILIDPGAILRVVPRLRPEDFYVDRHKWIFDAILKVHERGDAVDVLTLSDQLSRDGHLEEVGGLSALVALANRVPTSIHVEHYAILVERASVLRHLIQAATEIARMAHRGEGELEDILDQAEQLIFAISEMREHRELRHLSKAMDSLMEHLEQIQSSQGEVLGVPTGIRDLDEILGGFQRSDLIILAARPGMGKTSIALNMALHAALDLHKHVAFFSLEMSAEQLAQRLLSLKTNINSHKLRLGQITESEWKLLVETASVLAETAFYVDDTPSASVMEVRSKARRLHAEIGLDMVVIDYLQLMQSDRRVENRVQEISYISRALKALARELNVPVLALSQLSRNVEHRQKKRPMLSDLRESGSLEQDADVVIFLYPNEEDQQEEGVVPPVPQDNQQQLITVDVAKHRHGPVGSFAVLFDKAHTRFKDLPKQKQKIPMEY